MSRDGARSALAYTIRMRSVADASTLSETGLQAHLERAKSPS